MNGFHIAYAFLRVPRLFRSLFFWPLFIGLAVAGLQLSLSMIFLSTLQESPEEYRERVFQESDEEQVLRKIILGRDSLYSALQICKQGDNCTIQPSDISIIVEDATSFDAGKYQEYFFGLTERMHIGKVCKTEICIDVRQPQVASQVRNIFGLGLYHIAQTFHYKKSKEHFYQVRVEKEEEETLVGDIIFHPQNSYAPIIISNAEKLMVLVINIALLILTTIWLALRAHKKILNYFAKNGALLPLVAVCGKSHFYKALWVLTGLRVGCFLITSVPLLIVFLLYGPQKEHIDILVDSPYTFAIWIGTLILSISLAALIGSLAELKQRHSNFSFLYSLGPLCIALFGTLLWCVTLIVPGSLMMALQNLISIIPIVGVSPIIIHPIVKMNPYILTGHMLLSGCMITYILYKNATWFSSHLGEI